MQRVSLELLTMMVRMWAARRESAAMVVLPVLTGEKTRAEVARELKISRNTVYYHLKRFQEDARHAAEKSGANASTLRGLCGPACRPTATKKKTSSARVA